MPIRRYRSVADMPDAAWRRPLDPRNLELACDLSTAAMRLAPRRFPPGVHRYRTIDAARARRADWERSVREPHE
ncbi:MAG: hypothetical protein M3541_04590 [Acidobacteriota bacterium]|nr:hypothetical protein [Acidobacteriota bacterium]MDQ3418046.1 hypothetical protein [Acidobacteriota bacterium]